MGGALSALLRAPSGVHHLVATPPIQGAREISLRVQQLTSKLPCSSAYSHSSSLSAVAAEDMAPLLSVFWVFACGSWSFPPLPLMNDGEWAQLRKEVLVQVREIRVLTQQLADERARSAALAARVEELEAQLGTGRRADPDASLSASAGGKRALQVKPHSGAPSPRLGRSGSNVAPATAPGSPLASVRAAALQRSSEPSLQRTPVLARSPNASRLRTPQAPSFAVAVRVLVLLERAQVGALGCTCRDWARVTRDYLGQWRRVRLVLEMVDTERTYVAALAAVRERYLGTGMVGSFVLGADDAFCLFANLEDLHDLHLALYRRLQRLLCTWTPTACVAPTLIEVLGPVAESAYETYSANQADALEFLERLRYEERIPDQEWRALESTLIQPIQRVPRYLMLLREIASHSPPDHPDLEPIAQALQALARVGSQMQSGMEAAQYAHYMVEMAAVIADLPSWCRAQRALLCGEMRVAEDRKSKECFAALYPGQLVVAVVQRKLLPFKSNASTDSVASVATPLGKAMDAHTKQWKFLEVLELTADVAVEVGTDASVVLGNVGGGDRAVVLQCASGADAARWSAAVAAQVSAAAN